MEELGLIYVEINGQVKQVQAYRRKNGFDPMTGEPMEEIVVRDGFDPMTGEPVYVAVEKNGFDPMTGVQIFAKASSKKAANPGFQYRDNYSVKESPVESRSYSAKKNSKISIPIIIGIVVAAVVLVLAIALICILSSKQAKVFKAISKTIEDDTFGSVILESSEILSSNELTVEIDGEGYSYGEGGKISGTFATDMDNAEVYANASFEFAGVSAESDFYYDDSKLQLAIPSISDKVYEYDYTKKNNGIIAEAIEKTTYGEIEDVNILLSDIAKLMKKKSSYQDKVNSGLTDALMHMEIEKIDSEKYEVDGKDRKCKGYRMIVTERDVRNILRAVSDAEKDAYGDVIDEASDALENLTGEKIPDLNDMNEDIYEELEDLGDDIYVDFYIYKGMLAAISVDVGGTDLEVKFLGGDHRSSNMEVSFGGYTLLERESQMSKKVEEGNVWIDGDRIKYSYDTSSGDFVISEGKDKIEANYLVKGDSVSFSIDMDLGKDVLNGTLQISKGSRISQLKGDVFDVGNADQRDFMVEIEYLSRKLGIY